MRGLILGEKLSDKKWLYVERSTEDLDLVTLFRIPYHKY